MPNHIFLWVWKILNILHCGNLVRAPSSSTADPKSMILIIKSFLIINSSNMHQYLFVCKHCWFVCALNDENKSNYLVALRLTPFVQKVLPNRHKNFFCDNLLYITFELWYSRPWYHCVSPLVCAYIPPPAPPAYILDFFTQISEMTKYEIHLDIFAYFPWYLTAKDLKFRNTNVVAMGYTGWFF